MKKLINVNTYKETVCAEAFLKDLISFPCAGNHTCGKCKVKITGDCLPMSEDEAKLLSADEINSGVRLACLAEICGEATIEYTSQKQVISAYSKPLVVPQNPQYNTELNSVVEGRC